MVGERAEYSFEEQFARREKFSFPEGSVKVVDVWPDELKDDTSILIAPGWTENYDPYRRSLRVVSETGRRTLSFDYSRLGGKVGNETEYPLAEVRKAKQILNVLTAKGIDRVDVIAHSEGAINALIAATIDPSKFRNIVLDRPMGMVGPDNLGDLARRWFENRKREGAERSKDPEDPTSKKRVMRRTISYITKNPKRAWDEIRAMEHTDTLLLLKELEGRGILFSLIAGVDDLMSPVDRQLAHAHVPWPVEGYYSVVGTHNVISIRSESYIGLALNALDGLQRKRKLASR